MKAGILTRLKKLETAHTVRNSGPCVMIVYRLPGGGLEYNGEHFQDESTLPAQGQGVLLLVLNRYEDTAAWEAAALDQQSQQAAGRNQGEEQPTAPVKPLPTANEIKAAEAAATEVRINAEFQRMIDDKKRQRQNKGRYNWK